MEKIKKYRKCPALDLGAHISVTGRYTAAVAVRHHSDLPTRNLFGLYSLGVAYNYHMNV